jgi:hypothetical protein
VSADPLPPSRDSAYWAPSARLDTSSAPAEAINLNVTGRRVTSPLQGFGQLWQKRYQLTLPAPAPSPSELIAAWKSEFPDFWPAGNRFYGPLTGIAPGEVALLNLAIGRGVQLSTGVLVLYADDVSFTLMTPQGHMFAGWITFSARTADDGSTLVEANVLMRASDPLYEVALGLGGHRKEDQFWQATLTALAARFGVRSPQIQTTVTLVDRSRQWRYAGNIRMNSAISTSLYLLTHRRRRPPASR